MSKNPLINRREREIVAMSEYALCKCAYFAPRNQILFVTHPTIWVPRETQLRQPRTVVGTLDIERNIVRQVATGWHPHSRVTSCALVPNGLVSCSPSGLVFASFGAEKPKMLYGGVNYDEQVQGVTVHPDGSLWATSVFARRGVFIGRIVRVVNEIVEQIALRFDFRPSCIAISPDGQRCYVMCDLSKTIYYHRISGTILGPRQTLSFTQLHNVRSVKIDRLGRLFVSCGSELKCWDQHGLFLGSIILSETIWDFDFSPGGVVVMFLFRWVMLERDFGATAVGNKRVSVNRTSILTLRPLSRI